MANEIIREERFEEEKKTTKSGKGRKIVIGAAVAALAGIIAIKVAKNIKAKKASKNYSEDVDVYDDDCASDED